MQAVITERLQFCAATLLSAVIWHTLRAGNPVACCMSVEQLPGVLANYSMMQRTTACLRSAEYFRVCDVLLL